MTKHAQVDHPTATNEHLYFRMTIDVCMFTEDDPSLIAMAKRLKKNGGPLGVGNEEARHFMQKIKQGSIEIDEVRDVEDHTY